MSTPLTTSPPLPTHLPWPSPSSTSSPPPPRPPMTTFPPGSPFRYTPAGGGQRPASSSPSPSPSHPSPPVHSSLTAPSLAAQHQTPSYLRELAMYGHGRGGVLSREPSLPSLMSMPRTRPGSPAEGVVPLCGGSSGHSGHARRGSGGSSAAAGAFGLNIPLSQPSRNLKASVVSHVSAALGSSGAGRARPPPTQGSSALRAFEEGVGHYERVRSPSLRGHSRRGSWNWTLNPASGGAGGGGTVSVYGSLMGAGEDLGASGGRFSVADREREKRGKAGIPLVRTASSALSVSRASHASGTGSAWSLKEWVEERGRERGRDVFFDGDDMRVGMDLSLSPRTGEVEDRRLDECELDWNDLGEETVREWGTGIGVEREQGVAQMGEARVFDIGERLGVGTVHQGDVVKDFFNDELHLSQSREEQDGMKLLEIVRQVGVGSYAVVYLVREVLYDPALDPTASSGEGSSDSWDLTTTQFSISPGTPLSIGPNQPYMDPPNDSFFQTPRASAGFMGSQKNYLQGRGKGVVYGRDFALKCLSKRDLSEELLVLQRGEAELHRMLPGHPNIVALHRALETTNWLFLVIEYCPGQDLFYWLEQARDSEDLDVLASRHNSSSNQLHPPARPIGVPSVNPHFYPEQQTPPSPSLLASTADDEMLSRRRLRLISRMFTQMCDAVQACHAVNVCHRDIKPENFIVVDERKGMGRGRAWDMTSSGLMSAVTVKITDWGLGTKEKACEDFDCGSKPYMAYECRNNLNPTYDPIQADVWSLGIVLLNLLYHRCPWADPIVSDPDFSAFREAPVAFLLNRFEGMTNEVATYLAENVFCEVGPNVSRVSAGQFGQWSKDLIAHLGGGQAQASASDATIPLAPSSARGSSTKAFSAKMGSNGGGLAVSTASSRRHSQLVHSIELEHLRQAPSPVREVLASPTPIANSETVNLAGTEGAILFSPAPEDEESSNSPGVDGAVSEAGTSERHRRRKRGARKGRKPDAHRGGAETAPVSPSTRPADDRGDLLTDLAEASQSLAREISQATKSSTAMALKPKVKAKPSLAERMKERFRDGNNQDLQAFIADRKAKEAAWMGGVGDTASAPAKLQQQRDHHYVGSGFSQSTTASSGMHSAVSSFGTSSWGSFSGKEDEPRGRSGQSPWASASNRRERLSASRETDSSGGYEKVRHSNSSSQSVASGSTRKTLNTPLTSYSSLGSSADNSRTKLRHQASTAWTQSRPLDPISERKATVYARKDASTSTSSLNKPLSPSVQAPLPSSLPHPRPPPPPSTGKMDKSGSEASSGKIKLASLLTSYKRFNRNVGSTGWDR